MKTMVRLSFWAFFNLRPALLFPATNGRLVAPQRAVGGPLRCPAQSAQHAPSMHGGKLHAAFALDQIGHAPGRPQTGFVSERFGTALQSLFDSAQIGRREFRRTARARCAL